MPSRRTRRRIERQRAKRPPRGKALPPITRVVLLLGGVLFVAGGAALLVSSSSGNAARLGRVAGILIVIGLVLVGLAMLGRV